MRIVIDDGNTFEGTPEQFEDCFGGLQDATNPESIKQIAESLFGDPKIEFFSDDDTCPQCGHDRITTTQIEHKFAYGYPNSVELNATVPLRKCPSCGFEYFDWVSEEIRDEVVRQYQTNLIGWQKKPEMK